MSDELGATGRFPRGHHGKDDEGEISLGMRIRHGTIEIHFGKPVAWVGLGPDEAAAFIQMLNKHLTELRRLNS